MNIKTILSKPLPVVWYRFVQLVKLKMYFKTKFWQKIEPKVHQKVSKSKNTWTAKSELFSKDFSAKAFPENLQKETISNANEIVNGNILVFDVSYKFTNLFRGIQIGEQIMRGETTITKAIHFTKKTKSRNLM